MACGGPKSQSHSKCDGHVCVRDLVRDSASECARAQAAHAPSVCRWASQAHSVLKAAKSECSSVSSLADFERSPCILPAAEKTRSTPAEEAGAAKYCFTILARLGHLDSLACHHASTFTSSSGSSGSARYCSSSSSSAGLMVSEVASFLTSA